MKRNRLGIVLAGTSLACLLALAGGCGKATSSPTLGGETHWLQHCGGVASGAGAGRGSDSSAESDCGPGLECLCGVCTTSCTEDASCTNVDPAATCAARMLTPYAGGCGIEAPQGLCVQRDPDGIIEGRPYDVRGCFRAPEPVGLASTESLEPCVPNATHARGQDGSCWLFASSCLPDGFYAITSSELAPCEIVSDSCPDSLQCDAQQLATLAGCLSCDAARQALAERMAAALSRYGVCKSDADCIVENDGPSCTEQCAGAINRNLTDPFNREVFRLERGFCTTSGWFEKCGFAAPACSAAPLICRDGLCAVAGQL